jgi:hypothetical protein
MTEENKEDLPKPILIKNLGMLYPTENSKEKYRFGIYKCGFCGEEFRTRINNVKNGHTKSCGCYHKRRNSETHKTHGLTNSKLYEAWVSIKNRTLNPKNKQYNDYGGRGITICDEWKNDFMPFYNWALLNGYEENKGLSIDRIDNDGNYEPNNCRWTTQNIQARNQRVYKNNKSGYKGVCYHKGNNNYQAYINVNRKRIHLGSFKTPVEGAVAYNNYIIENDLEGFPLNKLPDSHIHLQLTTKPPHNQTLK